jgi:hypothetical protein
MQITNFLLLILLACVALVTSVSTSTYSFTFEIAMTGPEGTCTSDDLDDAARRLTKVVGYIMNLYLASEGILGQVTNVVVTQGSWWRFLGEVSNYEATSAMDALDGKQSDNAPVRNLAAMFTWKTGGAAICRLCPPAMADARRERRGLLRSSWKSWSSSSSPSQNTSEAISKEKISTYMNTKITDPTQIIIKRLPLANSSCTGSYELWTSKFSWT